MIVRSSAGATPSRSGQPPCWVTIFTSMFLHGSLLHLGGNMLFLWIFGNNIEDSMSRLAFIAFYLLGGLAALALQVVDRPELRGPDGRRQRGDRGRPGRLRALYPRARVVTLIFIIIFFTVVTLPALLVLGCVVPAPAAARVQRPDRRRRRGGVLRAHRRLPVRAPGDQAVRDATCTRTTSGRTVFPSTDGPHAGPRLQPRDHLPARVPDVSVAVRDGVDILVVVSGSCSCCSASACWAPCRRRRRMTRRARDACTPGPPAVPKPSSRAAAGARAPAG